MKNSTKRFDSRRTSFPAQRVACIVLIALLGVSIGGCGDSKAEMEAYQQLKDMNAIVVKTGDHPATLMLPASSPKVVADLDKTIEATGKLRHLTHLELTDLAVTDEHMLTVSKLRRINSLVLSGTQVGDEGLKTLASLPLNTLYVDNTKMTGSSINTLAGISDLEILEISGLDVSDISPLKKLEKLEWLLIKNTPIGGAAIDVMAEMPGLLRLSIEGSQVSDDDLVRLKKAKPSLKIDGPSSPEAEAGGEPADGAISP